MVFWFDAIMFAYAIPKVFAIIDDRENLLVLGYFDDER
jgi:hypothetical protein